MSILFHKEKAIHMIIKNKMEKKYNNIEQELSKDENYKQIIENWMEFADCLTEKDKKNFIKMIKECYFEYSKSITSNRKEKFDPCLTQTLLMALILHQQKQIDNIKEKQNFGFQNHHH